MLLHATQITGHRSCRRICASSPVRAVNEGARCQIAVATTDSRSFGPFRYGTKCRIGRSGWHWMRSGHPSTLGAVHVEATSPNSQFPILLQSHCLTATCSAVAFRKAEHGDASSRSATTPTYAPTAVLDGYALTRPARSRSVFRRLTT